MGLYICGPYIGPHIGPYIEPFPMCPVWTFKVSLRHKSDLDDLQDESPEDDMDLGVGDRFQMLRSELYLCLWENRAAHKGNIGAKIGKPKKR